MTVILLLSSLTQVPSPKDITVLPHDLVEPVFPRPHPISVLPIPDFVLPHLVAVLPHPGFILLMYGFQCPFHSSFLSPVSQHTSHHLRCCRANAATRLLVAPVPCNPRSLALQPLSTSLTCVLTCSHTYHFDILMSSFSFHTWCLYRASFPDGPLTSETVI